MRVFIFIYLFFSSITGLANNLDDFPTLQPEITLWTRTTAPVYSNPESIDADAPPQAIAVIPVGTKVDVSIVNQQGKPWSEWSRSDKPRAQTISKRIRANWQSDQADGIFFIKAEITEKNELGVELKKTISGYVARDVITNQAPRQEPVLSVFTPYTKKFLVSQKARKGKISFPGKNSKKSNNPQKEILRLINEFHNSFCENIHANISTDRDLRKLLLQSWDKFKKYKQGTPDEKWAAKAEEVDILARTVLHEAHIPGTLSSEAPRTDDCEWMLIAQSIFNRRTECKGEKNQLRGCREGIKNDLVGVATEPGQINIWMDKYILSQTITSCYLRKDLEGIKSNEYLDQDGRRMPAVEAKIYWIYRETFQRVLGNVMRVMGYQDAIPKESESDRVRRYFQITNFDNQDYFISDGNKQPISNPKSQTELLLNLRSYYHPLDMGECVPQTWAQLQYVRSTDIKCDETKDGTKKTQKKYIPLFRERIQVLREDHSILSFKEIQKIRNKNSEEYLPFKLRITPASASRPIAKKMLAGKLEEDFIDGEAICPGARVKVSDLVEPSESFACMPAALYPKCIDNKLVVGSNSFKDLKSYLAFEKGKLVSINLLSTAELEEMRAQLGPSYITDTHLEWNKLANQGVERGMVGVRCKIPQQHNPNQANRRIKRNRHKLAATIDFNGMCDTRLIPIVEKYK